MFDKVTSRISKLCYGLNSQFVDPARVCQKVLCAIPRSSREAAADRSLGGHGHLPGSNYGGIGQSGC